MSYKTPFYGISSHSCNNTKLFNFVDQNQKTGETLLQFKTVKDENNEEYFIGLPVKLQADGAIDVMSLMLVQDILDQNEHFKAANVTPKVYFL